MKVICEPTPLIAEIICAHCPGARAREVSVRPCVHRDWREASEMVEQC
jgi:hypothetical protein